MAIFSTSADSFLTNNENKFWDIFYWIARVKSLIQLWITCNSTVWQTCWSSWCSWRWASKLSKRPQSKKTTLLLNQTVWIFQTGRALLWVKTKRRCRKFLLRSNRWYSIAFLAAFHRGIITTWKPLWMLPQYSLSWLSYQPHSNFSSIITLKWSQKQLNWLLTLPMGLISSIWSRSC